MLLVYGSRVLRAVFECPQTKQQDTRTTIYRKTDEGYKLKMKASRGLYM